MENGSGRMEAGASSGSFDKEIEKEKVGDKIVEDQEVGDHVVSVSFVPGPLVPLKEHLDKDKEDESLRRWKEKLLGCVESDLNGQTEPEVTFHSIAIIYGDCGESTTPLPVDKNHGPLFTLREGSAYRFKLTFTVQHNIVSGLTYSNTVWKGGMQVDESKGMLGTFAPQREPYTHNLDEETTPSGVFARGVYSARLKTQIRIRYGYGYVDTPFFKKVGYSLKTTIGDVTWN